MLLQGKVDPARRNYITIFAEMLEHKQVRASARLVARISSCSLRSSAAVATAVPASSPKCRQCMRQLCCLLRLC